jgi:hypothetical protein
MLVKTDREEREKAMRAIRVNNKDGSERWNVR